MVKGLELFGEYFKDHLDKYVIIGGTACFLSMNNVGLDFRATKDIDIVLIVEIIDNKFIKHFWEFIKAGNYETRQKSTGKRQVYRFVKPKKDNYPYMLELFARKPDIIISDISENSNLVPIPANEDISSLSAILMNDSYYNFTKNGIAVIDKISVLKAEYLIPLKAKAWLDLKIRKESGELNIDSKNIKKHKNDIFRLFQIIDPESIIITPQSIIEDITSFINKIQLEPVDLKLLGLRNITKEVILKTMTKIYQP